MSIICAFYIHSVSLKLNLFRTIKFTWRPHFDLCIGKCIAIYDASELLIEILWHARYTNSLQGIPRVVWCYKSLFRVNLIGCSNHKHWLLVSHPEWFQAVNLFVSSCKLRIEYLDISKVSEKPLKEWIILQFTPVNNISVSDITI